ncbi:MAG TPA: hypothetical protein VFV99_05930 [Kofleriaceae bacterium]|nr:hypothetical protein [Kofleriaceae bacterium]
MPQPSKRAVWLLAGLCVAVALLVVLTLQGLRSSTEPAKPSNAAVPTTPSRATATPGTTPAVPDETPPWKTTPQTTGTLPPGTVPAWQVNPPPPDPSTPPPPAPREPANPALHRPAMDNPGGVNGARPERKVPGVE